MLKKLLLLFIVGFVIYYLMTSPSSAADAVGSIANAIGVAFKQVGVFVSELVS